MSCEQCIKESQNNRSLTCPPLQNPIENITAAEDTMQDELLPELTPSDGSENLVIAVNVFSRYLFAYLTRNSDAKTFAKVINKKMTEHSYLPTTLIPEKGSAFMSH